MSSHYPVLIVLAPVISAVAAVVLRRRSDGVAAAVVVAGLAVSFACSAAALVHVLRDGTMRYALGGWRAPIGIEYILDPLGCGMLVLASFVALAVALYAWPLLTREHATQRSRVYALYGLLACGLFGMIATGDAFNLYVHLEISSLAVYALIAVGGKRATIAAFRYLIVGTLGGTFYLLGLGYLYAVTGTLNMADLAQRLSGVESSPTVVVALALMAAGLSIKMALFPMHGWMPDAYAYSPPAITAFIAGIMSKVAAFALFRVLFFVMGDAVIGSTLELLGMLAAAAIVVGSIIALTQRGLRRMLAYSSVAQIGYVVLGFALNNEYALIGALLHILNHAVMKACLFLVAGGVKWRIGRTHIDDLVGAHDKLPWTMAAFVVAAISMVGLPPTAGFFSKYYLVLGAIEANAWPYIVVIAVSSLLNAVYFFRIIERVYLDSEAELRTSRPIVPAWRGRYELPPLMLAPIVLFGAGIVLLGVFSEGIVSGLIQRGLTVTP